MRLIDADALYEKFKNGKNDTEQEKDFNQLGRYLVKHAPFIDAIPVVHCKDCKYLGIKDLGYGYCKKKMAGIISPYDFCSYGERKEETHE